MTRSLHLLMKVFRSFSRVSLLGLVRILYFRPIESALICECERSMEEKLFAFLFVHVFSSWTSLVGVVLGCVLIVAIHV